MTRQYFLIYCKNIQSGTDHWHEYHEPSMSESVPDLYGVIGVMS
jgi:hypothetical protein